MSPLKITTNWTTVIQQRIPSSIPSTHLTDPLIETSEGGQVRVDQGGGKGEEWRQARDAAQNLQPGGHGWAKPGDRKN